MKATIEDLRKGDTVLISIGSVLSEVKLLRQPQLAKRGKLINWKGSKRWSTVVCAIRIEDDSYVTPSGYNYKKLTPVIAAGKEYTEERRVNFNDRVCWILNRESCKEV